MADTLTIPAPKPEDAEDVSWALSTAEAMFARGDIAEALKWIRRAAEAASEVDADERALELAKAAADLTSLSTRGAGAGGSSALTKTLLTPPAALPQSIRNAQAQAFRAQQAEYAATEPKTEPPPPSMPLQRVATKREVPLPSKGRAPRAAVEPTPPQPQSTRTGVLAPKRRRSQANLEEAARKAGALGEIPGTMRAAEVPAAHDAGPGRYVGPTSEEPSVPTAPGTSVDPGGAQDARRGRRKSHADREVRSRAPVVTMADEWDAHPTQNLTGDELSSITESRPEAPASSPPSAPMPTPLVQLPAIRVVLFRDADGIRMAPAGPGAPPKGVDALVIVLDPTADLAAWLEDERSEKPRRTRRS